ncbi:NADH:ubiquinone oxidoreductase [Yoonia sp.]|uniref:NADH:ubiquinone oxidoreductase n=1 Tax=Yoonia sp. TaxID=2212373 RepID=UPI0019FA0A57|nr:NADH:ubiquinone oxidoreductase [Yoonia sp.]MBE0413187.1 NADH:ubiquinone oxidoreductase [Yoonia sp.]
MINFNAPASKFEGIVAVAALFAIIAIGVAFVLYDYSFIAAVFVGAVVGVVTGGVLFLGWREPAPGPQAAPKPAVATAQTTATIVPQGSDGKPTFLRAARDSGSDDLKLIKGVGPKLEKILHDMGVFHFDQIAAWGPAEEAWMDDNLEGFKGRVTRDDWVAQAKALANGAHS